MDNFVIQGTAPRRNRLHMRPPPKPLEMFKEKDVNHHDEEDEVQSALTEVDEGKEKIHISDDGRRKRAAQVANVAELMEEYTVLLARVLQHLFHDAPFPRRVRFLILRRLPFVSSSYAFTTPTTPLLPAPA
ncbi:hypothetical protein LWI28_019312 [Acer negundo]|uniref:Uncharacterized protein n=1 Tax=Acer negundo TaxID=4023 RepID=A0AAD5IS97_ACENE|nr:hypothetical protein LWI28_019312 [Acer negundo]